MSRYIDADAYNDVIKKLNHRHQYPNAMDIRVLRNYLDEFPTADVVEVVRCEDCDYSMGITEKKCPMWENIGDPNGYCKWWQSTTIFHK